MREWEGGDGAGGGGGGNGGAGRSIGNKTSTSSTHFSTRSHDVYATGRKYRTCNRQSDSWKTLRKELDEMDSRGRGQFGSSGGGGGSTAATWWTLLGNDGEGVEGGGRM